MIDIGSVMTTIGIALTALGTASIFVINRSKDNTLNEFFQAIKFSNSLNEFPKLISTTKTDADTTYITTLPVGLNLTHFEKIQLSLEQYFNAKIDIKYIDGNIEIKTSNIKLEKLYNYDYVECGLMEIPIGYTVNGIKKIRIKSNMLVCGSTGTGKSTFVRSVLVNLIQSHTPDDLVVNLCDFKRTEYGIFRNANIVGEFVYDVNGLIKLIKRLEKTAITRYEEFDKLGIVDIEAYNKKHGKMKFVITFIDEIAQLDGNKEILKMLQKRVSFDRAAGMFYVISTQRPSVDLIPGSLKANIDIRVCFKTVDSTNSWIVLDKDKIAEYLECPGRGILKTNDYEEFQAMYISEDDVTNIINNKLKESAENEKL